MEFKNRIETYLMGKFPIITMNTIEVDRAVDEVKHVLDDISRDIDDFAIEDLYIKSHGFKMFVFDLVKGLYEHGSNNSIDGNTDLAVALERILSPDMNPGVYVVPMIHQILDDPINLPLFTAWLLECARVLEYQNKYLLLVGDTSALPREVNISTVSLDFEMPDRDRIIQYMYDFFEEIGLEFSDEEIITASNSCTGMTLREIENALKVAVVSTNGKYIDTKVLFDEKARVVKRSGLLEILDTNENMDTVGGMSELKEWMGGIHKIFDEPDKAKQYGISVPKGTMVTGISGCGKTLIAKAIANYLGVPLFRCDVGRIFGSLVGETERNTRELWNIISSVHPCVILLDEIEKMMAGMKSSDSSDAGVTSRFIGTMLYHLEEKDIPAFFVATANDVSNLPPELLRKGRWDEVWFVDLPNDSERMDILNIHMKKTGRLLGSIVKNTQTKQLVKLSENFTGAELEQVVMDALKRAFMEDREVTFADLKYVLETTVPLVETKKEEITALRKWASQRAKLATREDTKQKQTVKRTKGLSLKEDVKK